MAGLPSFSSPSPFPYMAVSFISFPSQSPLSNNEMARFNPSDECVTCWAWLAPYNWPGWLGLHLSNFACRPLGEVIYPLFLSIYLFIMLKLYCNICDFYVQLFVFAITYCWYKLLNLLFYSGLLNTTMHDPPIKLIQPLVLRDYGLKQVLGLREFWWADQKACGKWN